MTEISVKNFGSLIVGARCQFCGSKKSKILGESIYFNSRSPFPGFLVKINAVKSSIVVLFSSVLHVLRMCAYPKILTAIIQRVPVAMVAFFFWGTSENQSVHGEQSICSVKRIIEFAKMCSPIPLIEPLEIIGINDCVFVLRQGDKSVRCVRRLSDSVAFYAAFHRASFTGPVFSAASI